MEADDQATGLWGRDLALEEGYYGDESTCGGEVSNVSVSTPGTAKGQMTHRCRDLLAAGRR